MEQPKLSIKNTLVYMFRSEDKIKSISEAVVGGIELHVLFTFKRRLNLFLSLLLENIFVFFQ